MDGLGKRILDALKLYKKEFNRKVLKTCEEVEANTSDKYLVAAPVVGELINKLVFPDGSEFYLDVKDGERGFNSDPALGADTFIPFNNAKSILYGGLSLRYPVQWAEGSTLSISANSPTGSGSAQASIDTYSDRIYIDRIPNGDRGYITLVEITYSSSVTGGGRASSSINLEMYDENDNRLDQLTNISGKNQTKAFNMFEYPVAKTKYVKFRVVGKITAQGFTEGTTKWNSGISFALGNITVSYLQKNK